MSSSAAIPYIGSKISLVTNSELRYEGILININTQNSTVTLRDVRMSGTENRKGPHFVMPSSEVFDYIIFNGKDIKDLTVCEHAPFSVKEDPAVVAVNMAPPAFHDSTNPSSSSWGAAPPHMGMHMGQLGGMHGGAGPHHHRMHHQMAGLTAPPPPPHHGGDHELSYARQMGAGGGGYGSPTRGGGGMYQRPPFGTRGGGYGIRGGRGGGGGGPYQNNNPHLKPNIVIGELSPQPNSSLKTQMAEAFNFEEANEKFAKDKTLAEAAAVAATADATAPKVAYDKNASFFDNISCETLNRQQQHGAVRDSKIAREKQRELDTETFGPAAALTRGPRYFRRIYRRPPMGATRGGPPRGGGRMNYGRQEVPIY